MNVTAPTRWGYLLDELCQVRGINHAIATASDGLLMAASARMRREDADRTAAITSGVSSLTSGACQVLDAGCVESTIVDMTGGVMVIMTINNRALLTVLAAKEADLGQIVYEMGLLINRAGETFIPLPRDLERAR